MQSSFSQLNSKSCASDETIAMMKMAVVSGPLSFRLGIIIPWNAHILRVWNVWYSRLIHGPKGTELVFSLPRAAAGNHHRFGGSTQHKWMILQFCRSDVLNGSTWAKIKVSAEPCSFMKALGEHLFPCLYQWREAACVPWLGAPFSLFKASDVAPSSLSDYGLSCSDASFPASLFPL